MSTMTVSSGAAVKSRLNPHAPLFIPMAFQRVEDFSPEWWELVTTTTWFREHWFRQHQDQECFDAEVEDVANLLPESIDFGIGDELSVLEEELDSSAYYQPVEAGDSMVPDKERTATGIQSDADAVVRSLGLKSPKNGTSLILEPATYREKPMQLLSDKCSHRHIIQQPR